MHWSLKSFSELAPLELYAILQLRNDVFVVEQQCIFQDADNKDQPSFHLMGWKQEQLVAYSRLLPPGIAYNESSIGRVVTARSARKDGIGRILMERSIRECESLFGHAPIRIGAQFYLKKFYTSFGFSQSSEIYLEDGIEHIEMLRIH
jgi:ElaA protein